MKSCLSNTCIQKNRRSILTVNRTSRTRKKEKSSLKLTRPSPTHWLCWNWMRVKRTRKRNSRKRSKKKGRKRRGNEKVSRELRSFIIQILKAWRFYSKRIGREGVEVKTWWNAKRKVREDVVLWSNDQEITQAKSFLEKAYWVRTTEEKHWS